MDNKDNIFEVEEGLKDTPRFRVNLSLDEKIRCLEEILGKLKNYLLFCYIFPNKIHT